MSKSMFPKINHQLAKSRAIENGKNYGLLSLPRDVLHEIFGYLNPQHLTNVKNTCQGLREEAFKYKKVEKKEISVNSNRQNFYNWLRGEDKKKIFGYVLLSAMILTIPAGAIAGAVCGAPAGGGGIAAGVIIGALIGVVAGAVVGGILGAVTLGIIAVLGFTTAAVLDGIDYLGAKIVKHTRQNPSEGKENKSAKNKENTLSNVINTKELKIEDFEVVYSNPANLRFSSQRNTENFPGQNNAADTKAEIFIDAHATFLPHHIS